MAPNPPKGRMVATLLGALLAAELLLAPPAFAFGGAPLPVGLLGIPSLHSIIEAIAKGFFGALAGALVPGWLKHGTVATIQHLVALPDPASWPHVSRLQGETTYLAVMLLPVTLTVGALRYWLIGLTGAAHPATAVTRGAGVAAVLVLYRWMVEQTVAGTNTITHGILELPAVGDGLKRIIGVLFGGALLTGAGGVFGAFLVIVGVVFAAGLFAAQVLMTVILAVLIVAGPPLIAISAIPELSHLARNWAYALLGIALVPLGWTVLFATAGALCLDATSFTGASGGLPGHVAAAFAGLITFVIAARLPLMAVAQIRDMFAEPHSTGHAGGQPGSRMPGAEKVRAAHARLRAVGLEGVPSLGRSAARAAGALGAPNGGPVGAARRGLGGAARRGPTVSIPGNAAGRAGAQRGGAPAPGGVRGRLARARTILTSAPRDAVDAVAVASRGARRPRVHRAPEASGRSAHPNTQAPGARADTPAQATGAPAAAHARTTGAGSQHGAPRPTPASRAANAPGGRNQTPNRATAARAPRQAVETKRVPGQTATAPSPPRPPEMHPVRAPNSSTAPSAPASTRNAAARKTTSAEARRSKRPARKPAPSQPGKAPAGPRERSDPPTPRRRA